MSTFGPILKSPEWIARSLQQPVLEIVDAILEENFLQLERQSPAYGRYFIGSWILVNLLCEEWVSVRIGEISVGEISAQVRQETAFHTGQLLQAAHLDYLDKEWNPTVPVSDVIVWDAEVRNFRKLVGPHGVSAWQRRCEHFKIPVCESLLDGRPLADAVLNDLKEGRLSKVCRPLVEIVLDVYLVRGFTWLSDFTQGTLQQSDSPHPMWLMMPACRSLILQVTGDSTRAGDETVMRFCVPMYVKTMRLKETVDKILS